MIATNWLTGYATEGFVANVVAACLPVVEYSKELRTRAAEELALMQEGSAVVEMMGDYTMLRDQVRACLE